MMPALTKKRSVSWPMLSALRGDHLARLPEQLDQPPAQRSRLPMPSRSSQCCAQGGSAVLHVAEDARGVDVAALHLLDELGSLADQRPDDQRHRDDRDHDADQHAQEGARGCCASRSGTRSRAAAAGRRWRGSPPRTPRRRRAAAARRRPPRPRSQEQQEGLVFELGLHRSPPTRAPPRRGQASREAPAARQAQPKALSFSMKRMVPGLGLGLDRLGDLDLRRLAFLAADVGRAPASSST